MYHADLGERTAEMIIYDCPNIAASGLIVLPNGRCTFWDQLGLLLTHLQTTITFRLVTIDVFIQI